MTKHVIMVGSATGMITGQRIAFEEACRAVPDAKIIDNRLAGFFACFAYWWSLIKSGFGSLDVVYFTSSRTYLGFLLRDFPLLLLAKAKRSRVVNHLHGNDFEAFRLSLDCLSRKVLDWAYRNIAISCGPSSAILRNSYSVYPGMRLCLVRNFLTDERLLGHRTRRSCDGEIKLLYLSNYIESKGYWIAVEVAEILKSMNYNVSLVLAGGVPGERRERAIFDAAKAKVHGMNHIDFQGVALGEHKVDLFLDADVFLFPSTYPTEMAPLSVIEALAAGCLVVATPIGAVPEILDGFTAVVEDACAMKIVTHLIKCIDDDELKSKLAINRRRVEAYYSRKQFELAIQNLLLS